MCRNNVRIRDSGVLSGGLGNCGILAQSRSEVASSSGAELPTSVRVSIANFFIRSSEAVAFMAIALLFPGALDSVLRVKRQRKRKFI